MTLKDLANNVQSFFRQQPVRQAINIASTAFNPVGSISNQVARQAIQIPQVNAAVRTIPSLALQHIQQSFQTPAPVLQGFFPLTPPNRVPGPRISGQQVVNFGTNTVRDTLRQGAEAAMTLQKTQRPVNPNSFTVGGPLNIPGSFVYGNQPLQNFNDPTRPSGQFARKPLPILNKTLPTGAQKVVTPAVPTALLLANFLGGEEIFGKVGSKGAIQLAKNAKTYEEFAKGLDAAKPEVKTFVTDILKNKDSAVNTIEDFYKATKSATSDLRTTGKNAYTNVRQLDNPLVKGKAGMEDWRANYKPNEDWMNPEPLPWESQDYLANNPDVPSYNSKEIQDALASYYDNPNANKWWKSALDRVAPDIKGALVTWDNNIKAAQAEANKVAFYFKSNLNPDFEHKLIKYSQDPTTKTAKLLELSTKDLENGMDILSKNRSFNDEIFARAKAAGIDLAYLKNHILQAFMETPGQVDEALRARGLGQTPGFAQHRQIKSFQEGESFGLTPKYTTFGQLNAMAEHELQKALANKELFQKLIDSKQILPSNTPNLPIDWKTIEAPFFPQAVRRVGQDEVVKTAYKAPPDIARVLNNIFGQNDSILSQGVRLAGKASSVMQDVALSGGIGPLNFFGIGQMIKEATAGRIFKPAGAFLRSFSGTLSKNYEIANADVIKEMAAEGIDARGIANYQHLYLNIKHSRGIGELIGQGWQKFVNEPTFGRFMNQLQVEFFKDVKGSMLKKGLNSEEAIATAAKATKTFYGMSNKIGRSKDIDNALTTVFLAPKYRESMVQIFKNMGIGILPNKWGKPEYAGVQRLAAGMAVTFGLYNVAQIRLTGKPMWDNPPGKEFELVIPVGDPKDNKYVSVPFMPGFTALPRRIAGTVLAAAKGDIPEAGKQFSSLFSVPVGKIGEIASNQDYFGNPIYGQGTTPLQTATYGVNAFLPGYARAATDYLTKRATPAFSIAEGLELPIRKGTFPNKYYTAADEAINKLSGNDKLQAQYLLTPDTQGGPDSATESKMMLLNPKLLEVKKRAVLASNPNDPLYSRSDNDIKVMLAYRATEDTTIKAQLRVQFPWIPEIQYQEANAFYQTQQAKINPTQGYDPNSIQGQLGSLLNPAKPTNISNPVQQPTRNPMQQLTPEQVQIASAYTASPQGSATRKQLLAANPWLKDYWDANTAYYAANPVESKGPLADFLRGLGINPDSSNSSGYTKYAKKPKKIHLKIAKSKTPKSMKLSKSKLPKFKIAKSKTIKLSRTRRANVETFKTQGITLKINKRPGLFS